MIVDNGREFDFIRPSRRIRPQTPTVNLREVVPLPLGTVLIRKPRYAQRRCKRGHLYLQKLFQGVLFGFRGYVRITFVGSNGGHYNNTIPPRMTRGGMND